MSNVSQYWVRFHELETTLKADHKSGYLHVQPLDGGQAVEVDISNAARVILAGSHKVASDSDIAAAKRHGIADRHKHEAQDARSQGEVRVRLVANTAPTARKAATK